MNDTTLTMIGTLVDDPALKFTSSGAAVCSFRIANTPRKFDKNTNEWVDMKENTLFMSCSIWRQAAENVAEGLKRGDRVVVVGRLRQRSYETSAGEKRTVVEIECDEVAASLKFASVTTNRMKRSDGGGQSNGGGARQASGGAPADDPWASTSSAPSGGSFQDEAPF